MNWKLELIEDWNQAHHFASVQLSALFAIILTAAPIVADNWPAVAPTFIKIFPQHGEQWAPVIGLLLVIVGRVVQKVPATPASGS